MRWRVVNTGDAEARLLTAVQPHSRFRSDEVAVERALAPGAATELALAVRFSEPAGTVIENPFLILRVRAGQNEWRVLARVRVTAGHRGEPVAGTDVAVTTDRVGAV